MASGGGGIGGGGGGGDGGGDGGGGGGGGGSGLDGGISQARHCLQWPTDPHQHGRQRQQLYGKPSLNKTSQLGDFIDGQRKYGGAAAAVGQPAVQNPPCQDPVRRLRKSEESFGVRDARVQRVFQCLDEMMSPLLDPEKHVWFIPSSNFTIDQRDIYTNTALGTKRIKEPVRRPMKNEKPYEQPSGVPDSRVQQIFQCLEEMAGPYMPNHKREMEANTGLGDKKEKTGYEKNERTEHKESHFSCPHVSMCAPSILSSAVGSGGHKRQRETPPPQEEPIEEREIDNTMDLPAKRQKTTGKSNVDTNIDLDANKEKKKEVLALPRIILPITSSSLPTFNVSFSAMMTSSPSPISPAQSLTNQIPNHCTSRCDFCS